MAGPASGSVSNDPTPSFVFSSLDADSGFRCRIDGAAFRPAPRRSRPRRWRTAGTPSGYGLWMPLKATDVDWRRFKVDTAAPG